MRTVILLAIAIVVVTATTALIVFLAIHVASDNARYLTYYPSHRTYGGNETKIFLLNYDAKYDHYNESFSTLFCGDVNKGDPCFVISVTIRNDYTEEKPNGYFISLTAWLYNKEGEVVGRVMTPPPLLGSFHGGFVEVNLRNGETKTFDVYVAYEKQDVDRYELYVFSIEELPTP